MIPSQRLFPPPTWSDANFGLACFGTDIVGAGWVTSVVALALVSPCLCLPCHTMFCCHCFSKCGFADITHKGDAAPLDVASMAIGLDVPCSYCFTPSDVPATSHRCFNMARARLQMGRFAILGGFLASRPGRGEEGARELAHAAPYLLKSSSSFVFSLSPNLVSISFPLLFSLLCYLDRNCVSQHALWQLGCVAFPARFENAGSGISDPVLCDQTPRYKAVPYILALFTHSNYRCPFCP